MISASLWFLLLSFLHVFSGLCISSAKRLCSFSMVCDVLCLFPHLVSKERICLFFLLGIVLRFPTERKKMLVCRPDCQSFPTKLRIYNTFCVYIRPSMTASLSKAIFECGASPTTICHSSEFFLIRFLDILCLFVLLFTGICLSP